MRLTLVMLLGFLLAGAEPASAQTSSGTVYEFLPGSQLTDDCLLCDRIPIVVSITGTFLLREVDEDPLFTRYAVEEFSFHTTDESSFQYQGTGSGSYHVGGEVALTQEMFLELEIDNGVTKTSALCSSDPQAVTQAWPTIQLPVNQTNGTASKVYYLKLLAAPLPRITSLSPDPATGDVRLAWEAAGDAFQIERGLGVSGPFYSVATVTNRQSFTDVGVATNHSQLFYRVRRP